MIIASESLGLEPLTNLSTRDVAAGIIKISGKRTLVASIYLDINEEVVTPGLEKVIEYADEKKLSILIGLDTNAHSSLWMSKQNNSRGRALTDFIIHNHLNVENVGCKPTFECSTGKSIIDVTLSRGLRAKVDNWQVLGELNHSDHNTISFTLGADAVDIPPHRAWGKADWGLFSDELKECM